MGARLPAGPGVVCLARLLPEQSYQLATAGLELRRSINQTWTGSQAAAAVEFSYGHVMPEASHAAGRGKYRTSGRKICRYG
jgi:hypothetical protein